MNTANCEITHAVPSDNQIEKFVGIGMENALALWHGFPSPDDMAYLNANEPAQTPSISFGVDQYRSLSISSNKDGSFMAVLWERYGTTTLYSVSREKAEKLLTEFFVKKWPEVVQIFKNDASAVIIQGEKNPLKRWWTNFRLGL